MMRKKGNLILMHFVKVVVAYALLMFIPMMSITMMAKLDERIENKCALNDSIPDVKVISVKDSIKQELIEEVEKYIFKKFPKTHKTIPTSIVENGLEHGIDILFMMAQTQIETCFGTAGAGRETSRRSLFGVAIRKYESYDKAIKDYIAILKKNYLTRGRTEQHLMKKYTTTSGGRYAENPRYEIELSGAYAEINKKTNIKLLQEKYKKMKRLAML